MPSGVEDYARASDIKYPFYKIDLSYIHQSISYNQIFSKDFDPFQDTPLEDEASLEIDFDTDVRSNIQASGENCKKLWLLYQKHILPNTKYERA